MKDISIDNLENLIQQNMPFLIKTVSNLTGRYVEIENDEEFSIALSAFAEAVERYDPERGSFLSFVRLVIESRLKSYFIYKSKEPENQSIDELHQEGFQFADSDDYFREDTSALREEIDEYKRELLYFGMTLEYLADHSPKHRDTRINSIHIAEEASNDEETVTKTYEKRRLPIRLVASVAKVTEKIVKRNKVFILATMIIFVKNLSYLIQWISEARCKNVS